MSYLESGNFSIVFKVANPKKYRQAIPSYKIPSFRHPMSYCKASKELLSLLESL